MNIKTQMDLINNLTKINQSLWLDHISRDILLSNKLNELVKNYQILGLTSNPTIFEEALTNSNVYDESIKILYSRNTKDLTQIAYSLMIEDIQRACDIFKEIYEKSNKDDGYVSIEIAPNIKEKEKIITEAENLWKQIGRENLMIKIPSDKDGIEAMYELIKKGINVNMTLIFSPHIYRKVAEKYIEAIKWRYENNLDTNVFSVASFFVSRIDTYIDKKLDEIAITNPKEKEKILSLKGKTAISIALLTYSIYKELLQEFRDFANKGFKMQKLLWASTSTKNPSYKDTLYADELCLNNTINTLPLKTLFSFFNHGNINLENIEERIKKANQHIENIKSLNISLEKMYNELFIDGMKKFNQSYENLLKKIEEKLTKITKSKTVASIYNCDIESYKDELINIKFIENLFKKNPKLWKKEKEHIEIIKNSLGWVDVPFYMKNKIKEINEFRDEIINDGFKFCVILGMGGSSLACEVIRSLFEKKSQIKTFVLDTTNPDWIGDVYKAIDIRKTLFIFASKSGSTVEPNSQFKFFYNNLKKKVKNPSANFIAITDKNTPLEELAKKYKFRKIFINPQDIGGRFSSLSYFGILPSSLMGVDIERFLDTAIETIEKIKKENENCASMLGCFLSANYLNGKDKLTLILPKGFERFGLWIEQLIAESTGKEGKGIVPVIENEIKTPDKYMQDRMFVSIEYRGFLLPKNEEKINFLITNKNPVFKIYIDDIYDLARLFYIWEIATAIAGYFMKVNPFDQPDVVRTKEITKKILKDPSSIQIKPTFKIKETDIYSSNFEFDTNLKIKNYEDIVWDIFETAKENTYYSIMAFLNETPAIDKILLDLSNTITEITGCATIKSYGPRYLHSTGQLFKGGSDNGIYIILTTKSKKDIKIDGEDYTFEYLCNAQAKADFVALAEKKRKVLMFHFKKDAEKEIKKITKAFKKFSQSSEEENMPKTQTKKKNTQTNNKTNEYIVIDYPKHLETITSKHYTIRIGASECRNVEVSIDGGPWQSARYSVGYWWYDWNDIPQGNHEIIAKLIRNDGTYLISKRRRCKAV